MSRFTTGIEAFDVLIGLLTLLFFAWLAVHNIRNSTNKKVAGFLEFLRLTLVSIIILTLFEPEIVTREQRTEKPQLKIIYDSSGSMETEDVLFGDSIISRKKQVADQLESGIQDTLKERYDISVESFSKGEKTTNGTDIQAPLMNALDQSEKLKSVILVSDGSWNGGGNPLDAAIRYRSRGVPVYTLTVGRDRYLPDLVLEKVDPPTFGLVNEKILIPFTVRNYLDREMNVTVSLKNSRLIKLEKTLRIPAGQTATDAIIWQPKFEGKYEFDISVPVLDEEINKQNNSQSFTINVRQELLKVLVIDTTPRWEYRYLRNALMRDPGVNVKTLLLHQGNMKIGDGEGYLSSFPDNREDLSTYDVIFLGDVGVGERQLSKEQLEMIRNLVEKQGSGVVFMPGLSGNHLSMLDNPIEELIPVVYDERSPNGKAFQVESKLLLTTEGKDHLLTLLSDTPSGNVSLWKQLPGFYWNAAVRKAKVGASVLAVHSSLRNESGRMPLLVTRPFGNGNTLFLGTDSAWRWRKGVEDKYHYRFWGQVVRWMANKRHMSYSKQVRLFYSPSRIIAGDVVSLQATIMDKAGFPKSGSVIECAVLGPDKTESLIKMEEVEGGWGLYKADFKASVAGDYKVIIRSQDKTVEYETTLNASGETLEKIGEPANFSLMHDIARITNAETRDVSSLASILDTIQKLPEEKPRELRLRIWNQWWWGGIIILLAGIYWISRKRLGLV